MDAKKLGAWVVLALGSTVGLLDVAICKSVSAASDPRVVLADKKNISGHEDGQSWLTAYSTLQAAVNAAATYGDAEVWVAGGTYDEARPFPGAVQMMAGVRMYGGFAGQESTRDQRDWRANVTTIDGSKSVGGSPARHVVMGADNASLDGFTITGGKGTNYMEYKHGGGMYNNGVSPVVTNCIFTNNNSPEGYGGGMYNASSHVSVSNCLFTHNASVVGGGIYNNQSTPSFINCLVAANGVYPGLRRSEYMGGMYNILSDPVLTNCILWDNLKGDLSTSSGTIRVSYSCVRGGHPGVGNMEALPQFRSDFSLPEWSPCIDRGTGEGAPAIDLLGTPRPQGSGVDMGRSSTFRSRGRYGTSM